MEVREHKMGAKQNAIENKKLKQAFKKMSKDTYFQWAS